MEFKDLVGMVLKSVVVNGGKDEILFTNSRNIVYKMHHNQDCCESVQVEDITGDLQDLVNTPILMASEESNSERPSDIPVPDHEEEFQTWTFYRLSTIKGTVVIRWYGTSNGYYSESVDFEEV